MLLQEIPLHMTVKLFSYASALFCVALFNSKERKVIKERNISNNKIHINEQNVMTAKRTMTYLHSFSTCNANML